MKLLTILFALLISASALAQGSIINVTCYSDSGSSRYDVYINTRSLTGEIRYRFSGQDITYRATITSVNGQVVQGTAVFESSRSGEIRGNSFSFTFDDATKIFIDNSFSTSCNSRP